MAVQYYDADGPGPDSEGVPFTENQFSDDPFERPVAILPPGEPFHSENFIEYEYDVNIAEELPTVSGLTYSPIQLQKTTVYRRRWNHSR